MISMMSNTDCEFDRKSEVSDRFPTFELESPDEEAGFPLDMGMNSSNGTSDGGTEGITNSIESDESGDSSDLVEEDKLDNKFETRVSDNLYSCGGNSGFDVGHVEPVKTESEEARAFSEVGSRDLESRVSEIKAEAVGKNDCFDAGAMKAEEGAGFCSREIKGDVKVSKEPTVSDFSYAYSRVDEGTAARMTEAFGSEAARALSYGFEPGDMVWGKVKSHPWWPGHIFSEAFASPSVRRTKREGHLLVAFFGDSSYGWFDTAELIPFEPHYAEKSRQLNTRTFVKAVEEAVDEARRRAALGLTCYCRNPFNFRPTSSQGYFSVDVSGFEPGGLYSVKQIKKSRENFQPSEALSFIQQMAIKPRDNDQSGIDCIKNVALFLAYRKATFEDFDETYAQAFGVQPVRPNQDSMAVSDQLAKMSSRAPLSGPMVFAEALGERKSSTKPSKVKNHSKKDKYVLKRRDKPNEPHFSQGYVGVAASAYKEGIAAMAPGDYIFQKRTPTISMVQPVASSSTSTVQGDPEGGKLLIDIDMDILPEMNGRMTSGGDVDPTSTGLDGSIVLGKLEHPGISHSFDHEKESKAVVDLKQETAISSNTLEHSKPILPSTVTDNHGPDHFGEGDGSRNISESVGTPPLPVNAKLAGRVVKKAKIHEQPENLNSDKTVMGEKKKKKKKKVGLEGVSEHLRKPFRNVKDVKSLRKSTGKSIGIELVPGEDLSVDLQKKQESSSNFFLSNSALLPNVDLGNNELELAQLVTDLLALALDPFHGVERNSPEIVRHVFLQFRSLVYQKSLVLVPVNEAEASEFSDGKSPAGAGPSEIPTGNDATGPPRKQPKPLARPDDPTRAGRKRSPSERQEEKSAKRLKKLKDLKSLATEKKAGIQKIPEEKQVERKEAVVTISSKLNKLDTVKKTAPPVRVAEPMMLSMKFPPRTTLPSVPELKAKFARFGPLDPSAFRVFWKSSTCRVVFKYKSHAEVAYRFAIQNKGFFGQVRVNYQLRDVAAPAPEESGKRRADEAFDDFQPFRAEVGEHRRPQQSPIQLKSCLKKPSGEDTGSASGVPRENPRVKFMLGGEESSSSSRGEQLMVSGAKVGASSSSSSSSSSTLAMDVNRTNFQKVIPSTLPLPPLLPLPSRNLDFHHESRGSSHFTKAPTLNFSQVEEPRKPSTSSTTSTTSSNNNNSIDISSQMLSLMMRCNDIIMNVKSSFGHVPRHPL